MTADYPTSIFALRDIENVAGNTYDATKKNRFYAEDLQALAAEISALETILGLLPSGAYDTVVEWLDALAAGLAAVKVRKYTQESVETPDGSITIFTMPDTPSGNVCAWQNGARLGPAEYTWVSGNTVTMTVAPVGAKPLFDYDL